MLTVSTATLDAFDDGTTLGWSEGDRSPNPPEFVESGGPDGAGDGFVRNISGGFGPGSRLVMFNESDQWIGDYQTAGVVGIQAQVANFGDAPLSLRIALATGDSGGNSRVAWYASSNAAVVAADGQWTTVTFEINESDLVQVDGSLSLAEVLSDVTELRILSSADPDFRGDAGDASLGVDNIQALGETPSGLDFHNEANPVDVNNDGAVSPLDALFVINELNARLVSNSETGELEPGDLDPAAASFIDVDNDGVIAPRDALLVINTLNEIAANAPTAGTDIGFTVAASDTLNVDIATLLANDSAGNPFTLQSVSNSSLGANVSIVGDQVVYVPGSSATLAGLDATSERLDSFSYTIETEDGLTTTGQVSVRVLGQESVRFRLEAVDTAGNPIDTIAVGAEFGLAVYVEDVRSSPTGVFSPYLDINFLPNLSTADGTFEFGSAVTFPDDEPGKFATSGLVDEAGAFLSFEAVDSGEVLVFTIPFTASQTTGAQTFIGDPADIPEFHDLTYSGSGDIVPGSQVTYGRETLRVIDASFAALAATADDFSPTADVESSQ